MTLFFPARKPLTFPYRLTGQKSNQISLLGSKFLQRLLLVFSLVITISCNNQDGRKVILTEKVSLNPSGYAPLSASIILQTKEKVWVRMRVVGQDGPDSDVVHDFPGLDTNFDIPVHGLYAGNRNTVELTFYDAENTDLNTRTYVINTQPLLAALPKVTIEKATRSDMAGGMTLVSYYGHDGIPFPQKPFIFDSYGKIRWYLDYGAHPELKSLFYEDGMERLANGNFFFGSGGEEFGVKPNNRIYEIDLFGNIVNSWDLPGYGFHHEAFEKPNGNFLVTVNKLGADTIEDYVIEVDRKTNEILNEWDLNQSLNNGRKIWTTDGRDWIHANAVLYDETDDTIIVSGRTQGIVKLTEDNQVVWILAPHKDWGTAGNGQRLEQFLLTPLDANGQPITDEAVLQGDANHPNFEWPWFPHAPMLAPNGELMVFDNGNERNYTGLYDYSRAVSYRINVSDLSIRQRWEYGKDRGKETFSRIVGDVDFLEDKGHVLFSPGNVRIPGAYYGKSIEVDYPSGEVIFEATITPPMALFDLVTLNRTERLPLYPE